MTMVDVMSLGLGVAVGMALARQFVFRVALRPSSPIDLLVLVLVGLWLAGYAVSFVAMSRAITYRRRTGPDEWLAILVFEWMTIEILDGSIAGQRLGLAEGPHQLFGFKLGLWSMAGLLTLLILAILVLLRLVRRAMPEWMRTMTLVGLSILAFWGPISVFTNEGIDALSPIVGFGPGNLVLLHRQTCVLLADMPLGLMLGLPLVAASGRIIRDEPRNWEERAAFIISAINLSLLLLFAFFSSGSSNVPRVWLMERGMQIAWVVVLILMCRWIVHHVGPTWNQAFEVSDQPENSTPNDPLPASMA